MATLIWGRVESEMPRWQPVGVVVGAMRVLTRRRRVDVSGS